MLYERVYCSGVMIHYCYIFYLKGRKHLTLFASRLLCKIWETSWIYQKARYYHL